MEPKWMLLLQWVNSYENNYIDSSFIGMMSWVAGNHDWEFYGISEHFSIVLCTLYIHCYVLEYWYHVLNINVYVYILKYVVMQQSNNMFIYASVY